MASISRLSLLVFVGGLACGEAIRAIGISSPGNCTCLSWKETYKTKKASCGDALETYTYSKTAGKHMMTFHFCEGAAVYSKQRGNYCTKVAQGSILPTKPTVFAEGAWCYVPSDCAALNGGAPVNAQVSWKTCVQGQDPFLADLDPADLNKYASANGQDIGLLVQMAYPVFRVVPFRQVREVFLPELPQTLPDDARASIQAVIDSGRPTMVCEILPPAGNPDSCGQGEVFVIVGKAVWRMDTMQCKTGAAGCTAYAS